MGAAGGADEMRAMADGATESKRCEERFNIFHGKMRDGNGVALRAARSSDAHGQGRALLRGWKRPSSFVGYSLSTT